MTLSGTYLFRPDVNVAPQLWCAIVSFLIYFNVITIVRYLSRIIGRNPSDYHARAIVQNNMRHKFILRPLIGRHRFNSTACIDRFLTVNPPVPTLCVAVRI